MHRGQMACFFYLINENRPEYEDEDVDRLSFSAAPANSADGEEEYVDDTFEKFRDKLMEQLTLDGRYNVTAAGSDPDYDGVEVSWLEFWFFMCTNEIRRKDPDFNFNEYIWSRRHA